MLEPPTGWQFVLERPGQRAVVTEVGAALRSWSAGGAERLDGFGVDSIGDGVSGRVLAPWPDRGPLLWVNWRPVRRAADRVALGYVLHPQPGYPFTVGVEVEYALQPAGLDVRLSATNLGDEPAPFGAGFRPRVRAGEPHAPEPGEDGGARLRAGDVALWADAGFARLRAEAADRGVTLVCDTGDSLLALAPGEAFAGRWGLSV
jgi:Aldose 1-epimerase